MRFLLLLSLFTSLYSFSIAQTTAVPAGQIVGKVTTSNGEPAGDATVKIKELKRNVLTDRDGAFRFDNIQPGTYNLQVSFVGHEMTETFVTVPGNAEILIRLPE